MVYNTIENKAELSALTYLQQGSRVNKRLYATILSGACAVRRPVSLYGYFLFRLEVFNY